MINVMFLGSSNVGKTTILQSYINHKFYDKSSSTIGIEKVSTKISDSSDLLINVYYNNYYYSIGILQEMINIIQ